MIIIINFLYFKLLIILVKFTSFIDLVRVMKIFIHKYMHKFNN